MRLRSCGNYKYCAHIAGVKNTYSNYVGSLYKIINIRDLHVTEPACTP